MVTVDTLRGWRIVIYSNDHRPAHVHVNGPRKSAVFLLNCPGGPVSLRECKGFSSKELQDIEDHLNQHVAEYCAKWGEIHDNH
ncbi:DUF4160 domain-containing protein [Burkholderia vietnamiensis]|uniref:DUF4160 domain-containing protein n=1 Tax=Burkholderia vietnamiensis TaxID=60552 RepID=UPI0009C14256